MACTTNYYPKTGDGSIRNFVNELKDHKSEIKNDKMGWYALNQRVMTGNYDKEGNPDFVCADVFENEFSNMTIAELQQKYGTQEGGRRRKINKRARTKRRTTSVNKKRQSRNRRK